MIAHDATSTGSLMAVLLLVISMVERTVALVEFTWFGMMKALKILTWYL